MTFIVTRHAANRWEVTGELPRWRGKGVAEAYDRVHTTKKAAERDAKNWNRRNAEVIKYDLEERALRLRLIREYLAKRAARPVASQLTFWTESRGDELPF